MSQPSGSNTSEMEERPQPQPQLQPIAKIQDGLYLGDSIDSRRKATLQAHNIKAVASLSDGKWVHWSQPWYKEIIPEGNHLFLPCNDSLTQDLLPQLGRICDFIDTHIPQASSTNKSESSSEGNILVHCDKGISRSPTAVIAYLMRTHTWDFEKALEFVREKRKIKPNKNFQEQLKVWEATGYEIWADSDGTVPKEEYAAFLEQRAERLRGRGLTGDEPIGLQSL